MGGMVISSCSLTSCGGDITEWSIGFIKHAVNAVNERVLFSLPPRNYTNSSFASGNAVGKVEAVGKPVVLPQSLSPEKVIISPGFIEHPKTSFTCTSAELSPVSRRSQTRRTGGYGRAHAELPRHRGVSNYDELEIEKLPGVEVPRRLSVGHLAFDVDFGLHGDGGVDQDR